MLIKNVIKLKHEIKLEIESNDLVIWLYFPLEQMPSILDRIQQVMEKCPNII